MHIICNGNEQDITEGTSLQQLLEDLQLAPGSVVAEINNKIIKPDQYAQLQLKDGDHVELIRFVGGG